MSEFQKQVAVQPKTGAGSDGASKYPNPIMDLENTYIEKDGKRLNVADLLRQLHDLLGEKKS